MRPMHRRPEDKDLILNRERAKNAKEKIDWVDGNRISEGSSKTFLGVPCPVESFEEGRPKAAFNRINDLSEAPQTKRDKLGG
jgi:hypothetical protein